MQSKLKILIFLLLTQVVFAANHYILDGASGINDGSDWTNAYEDLDDVAWIRGDTYYLGDGTYLTNYDFNTANSGTDTITIKKAIASDHGTETGWNSAFGDGQAISYVDGDNTPGWCFSTDYWIVDGQTGGGPGNWDGSTTQFGIKLECINQSFSGNVNCYPIVFGNTLLSWTNIGDNCQLIHIEIKMPGWCKGLDNDQLKHRAIFSSVADYVNDYGPQNCTFSYLYIHDVDGEYIMMNNPSNLIVQYCLFKNNASGTGVGLHTAPWVFHGTKDTVTFRWNQVINCSGTAVMDLKRNFETPNDVVEMYGNLIANEDSWHDDPNNTGLGEGIFTSAMAGNYGDPDHPVDTMRVYNNTISRITGFGSGVSCHDIVNASAVYNNLYYDCGRDQSGGDGTENIQFLYETDPYTLDYNIYYDCEIRGSSNLDDTGSNGIETTGNPFTNRANGDYTLSSGTTAGVTLGSPYNTDWTGNTRGSDGTWDRGALEYNDGGGGSSYILWSKK